MVNISVPRINTLHGMPSLLHLSSTQSELGNCNEDYSGFNTDLSTPASVDDQINTNYDSVTDPVIEKYISSHFTTAVFVFLSMLIICPR
jgi:hypothetical protein